MKISSYNLATVKLIFFIFEFIIQLFWGENSVSRRSKHNRCNIHTTFMNLNEENVINVVLDCIKTLLVRYSYIDSIEELFDFLFILERI
jgi:hypothetical protein